MKIICQRTKLKRTCKKSKDLGFNTYNNKAALEQELKINKARDMDLKLQPYNLDLNKCNKLAKDI